MAALARYWMLWCVNPGDDRLRYQHRDIPSAKAFCYQKRDNQTKDMQQVLLSLFRRADSDAEKRAQAGLCLRCYVSDPILKACKKIDSLFSGNKAFSYQDLLPFVLNDDGQKLVVLSEDDKTQQVVCSDSHLQPSAFKIFAVEVLRTYKGDDSSSMSLDNWAFLRTKQHPELKNFLAEFGFKPFSDWTLLNRIQQSQLVRLTQREQLMVEAFHAVYRRDRRAKKQYGRCEPPTAEQLTEMNALLERGDAAFGLSSELLTGIKQIAQQLRAFDIWSAREPLEIKDQETGDYILRGDLPAEASDESEIDSQDFLAFLQQQLAIALTTSIEQAVQSRIAKLKKSKKYAPFASAYLTGLRSYYEEGRSLREIGPQLGMSSWDQTRRILNPGELLSQVRQLTAQFLLAPILKEAQAKGLSATPADPEYLRTLMEQIELFIDSKIFGEAVSETKAGKNRSLNSEYARVLISYLQQYS
ncbi:MAG: hypothetical protein ACFB16_12830 [Phormidesmis sp.]